MLLPTLPHHGVQNAAQQHLASTQAGQPEPKDYKAIPVPPVTDVKTYGVDYLPVHKVPVTYLKAPKEIIDKVESEWQEYDLDVEDEEFLREVNDDGMQERLTWRQLEEMLWHLEVKNAEANERVVQGTGA